MKIRLRSRNGSIAFLAITALLPCLALICAIGADLMHVDDATGQLQRATDAAALAGANYLDYYVGGLAKSGTMINSANEPPVNYALIASQLNTVEGAAAYTNGDDRTVTVTIRFDPTYGPGPNPNRCDVTETFHLKSVLSQVFANFGQDITTTASAAIGQVVDQMGAGFMPILVSTTQSDPSGRILKNASKGTQYTVQIKGNSIWVYNPNPVDKAIIDSIGDPANYPPVAEAPITIGDMIDSDNGVKSAGKDFGLLVGKTVVFPVTADFVGSGPPKHKVIGFFGLKIQSYTNKNPDPSLTGTITAAVGPGVYSGHGQDSDFSSIPFVTQGGTVNIAHLIE